MNKHSRLAFGVLCAGVIIFVAVQVVSAEVISGPYTIAGIITSMDRDGLVFDEATVDGGETVQEVHVYGMGPAWYWDSLEVEFPRVGDSVSIEAYVMDKREYVAAAFIDSETQEPTITLREEVLDSEGDLHLIPMWSNSTKLPTTETTVISADSVDCNCDCTCYCLGDDCDCACDCEDCLEEQHQYQGGKKNSQ